MCQVIPCDRRFDDAVTAIGVIGNLGHQVDYLKPAGADTI